MDGNSNNRLTGGSTVAGETYREAIGSAGDHT